MKHERYPGHSGTMLVEMPVEDWIWWCKFLAEVLAQDDNKYTREDLECIIRSLNKAEEAVYEP